MSRYNFLLVLIFYGTFILQAQKTQTISRYWTSFYQSIDILSDSPKKFKVTAYAKTISSDKTARSGLWARVDTKNDEPGFFDNMSDRPIKSEKWQKYEIIGEINPNSKTLYFGGICLQNGEFYFDDFKLFIENDEGLFESVELKNSSFETKVLDEDISQWHFGIRNEERKFNIKEFTTFSSTDALEGKQSLLIKGSGITQKSGVIVKEDSESPQIDAMISMLNDLKDRVVDRTQLLSQYEIDYLHDDKANRIGALIMHLAAAEVYYQVFTFENRGFNEEEQKKWGVALDLGPEAREVFQGQSVSHYLDIYDEVRKKTISELKKRDDKWFEEFSPGNSASNHYYWFHVMEHQSSHLGQILFLKKRIPPEEELNFPIEIKG